MMFVLSPEHRLTYRFDSSPTRVRVGVLFTQKTVSPAVGA